MRSSPAIAPVSLAVIGALGGCQSTTPDTATQYAPEYRGIETRLLDGDLVNFRVEMTGARDREDVARYARCAAAQYTLIRGYGFARHLRTSVTDQAGIWSGDAIYTISPDLPDGLKTIDAEVVAADCAENGIPMV